MQALPLHHSKIPEAAAGSSIKDLQALDSLLSQGANVRLCSARKNEGSGEGL